jgi:O-antigen/teichoic acid export membrane protein
MSTAELDTSAGMRSPGEARGAARMARIFVALLSADIVTRGLTAVATVIVVRLLAPDAFGEVAFALAAAAVTGVLVDLGLWMLLVRDVSEEPARAPRLLGAVLRLEGTLGLSVFGAGVALALAGLVPGPASGPALALGLGVMAANALVRPFEATLTGYGRAHLVAIGRTVSGATLVAATVFAALTEPAPESFLGASVAAEVVGLAAIAGLCRAHCFRLQLRVPARELLALLRRAVPFALLVGFGLLYLRVDLIMLGLLGSEAAVGNYGFAARVLETAVAVPAFFGGAFLATVAQTGPATERAADQTTRALRYVLLICVPLTFAIAMAAGPLVDLVAGRRYDGAGDVLLRLSPVLTLTAAYAVLANLQVALDRTSLLVKISLAGIALKVVLNAWAIPRWGAEGAALAAVAGEALVVTAQWYSARRHFDVSGVLAWCGRLALSAATMVAVGLLIAGGLPWLGALVAGLAAFALAAGLTHTASISELRLAWTSVARTS